MGKVNNRKYKDSVFVDLFSEDIRAKENFLSLYNALHEKPLESTESLEKLRLDQVMYMKFANDVSYLAGGKIIILAEHQSTINPNMPLRCLEYIARLYEKLQNPEDKYLRRLVKIPSPEFYVFYNGTEDYPENKTLLLSEAFLESSTEIELELKVKVINLNKAQPLLQKCRALEEYSLFIETVRKYIVQDKTEGFTKAVKECIKQDILKEYLQRKSREVINMLVGEYDYATDIAVQRAEERSIALAEGKSLGLIEGKSLGLIEGKSLGLIEGAYQTKKETAKNLISLGMTFEVISKVTGLSIEEIEGL